MVCHSDRMSKGHDQPISMPCPVHAVAWERCPQSEVISLHLLRQAKATQGLPSEKFAEHLARHDTSARVSTHPVPGCLCHQLSPPGQSVRTSSHTASIGVWRPSVGLKALGARLHGWKHVSTKVVHQPTEKLLLLDMGELRKVRSGSWYLAQLTGEGGPVRLRFRNGHLSLGSSTATVTKQVSPSKFDVPLH